MSIDAWKRFAADFNNMSDADVNDETRRMQDQADEAETWLEAVASWEQAGRPRSQSRQSIAPNAGEPK